MFFAAKLLAFLPFGNFLRGTLGKWVMALTLVMILYGGFQYWLSRHDRLIRDQLLVEYNQQQSDLTRQLQLAYDARLADVTQAQNARIAELNSSIAAIRNQRMTLIDQLRNTNLSGGDSSAVLRGAIQLLTDQRVEN